MQNLDSNFQFSVPDPGSVYQRFKRLRHDPELLQIKQKLMAINVFENPRVQYHYRLAKLGTKKGRQAARVKLLEIIEAYKVLFRRQDDDFMPYATADQISCSHHDIHILNQYFNNIPMRASPYGYLLGSLILGPQGGGKTSAVFHQLCQLDVPKLILDPKDIWKFRAEQLAAEVIPPEYMSFDCGFEDEDKLPLFLHGIMEGVAQATGLQYGLTKLNQACDIALEQRRRYIEQTGQNTPLCLKDIYISLDLCDSKNPKQKQYLESAKTALDLILGRNNLFATRQGIPMESLLNGNYILPCQYLSVTQSRFLGWFILEYIRFTSIDQPETTQLKSLVVIDDSSKFISKPDSIFGSAPKTGIYLHQLSTLRSSGRGTIFIDQLVEPVCDDIKQLCNNWLVVGGMRGTHNQNEIASAMSLTRKQADMLGRLKQREAVCFYPTTYPYAIHGTIPTVPEPGKQFDEK